MKAASTYGAFNARWLEPEDVARSFVPTPHFKSLVRLQHSLLMGPRGCGKTTLLKMLTRRAQAVWQNERLRNEEQWTEYRHPDFEAIYIPSDVRWNSELSSISANDAFSVPQAESLQRALVSIAAVIEAIRLFQNILDDASSDSTPLLKSLITHLSLGATVPSFPEIRLRLLGWAEELQSLYVSQAAPALASRLQKLPATLTGHALGGLARACTIFSECAPTLAPVRWALCFDELEIAPCWLQTELLASLRSFDQKFLLKLTWSPLLPNDLKGKHERQHDYEAIRMWHGHVSEARPFCKEFTTRFVRDKFDSATISPRDVFGISPFAYDERGSDNVYIQNGPVWTAMVRLAELDRSFREYLSEHSIDPTNPVVHDVTVRDESLRKIKPIVLLRDAYLKEVNLRTARRSRKNPLLFYGEEAIYAMSEGNPRLLAGLLNDLVDADPKRKASSPPIKQEVQSRSLRAASQRTLSGIKAYPIQNTIASRGLAGLVQKMGTFLHSELISHDFSADPAGGFQIDEDIPRDILDEIEIGLLIGAFVHVKSDGFDIPDSVVGCRIRLSYMLAPYYGLPLRSYRSVSLSSALRNVSIDQRAMFLDVR